MQIVEWWRKGDKKPIGIIGLDDDGKLFVKGSIIEIIGFDEEDTLDDLRTNVEDENGNHLTEKDGVKFLEGAIARYMRNVYDGEINLKGPFVVKMLPELENLDKGG
jgi:hypothetical protein